MITSDMVGDDAVVADVGINVDESGNLCGDVDFDAVEPEDILYQPGAKRSRKYYNVGACKACGMCCNETGGK